MTITYEDEAPPKPAAAARPKIVYEERRAEPKSGPLPINAGIGNFAATMLGIPVDTVQNVLNLGRAGIGTVAAAAGRADLAPDVQTGAVGSSEWLRQKLRNTGIPGLSPDNPNPKDALGTLQYDLVSRGGFMPGGVAPALGSIVAEKLAGPEYAAVGAMVPGAVGQVAKPMMQDASRALMQQALKPTLTELKKGTAAKAIDTMLEGGFNPTKGGVEKMRNQIDVLNGEIKEAIANSPATVNKVAVGNNLQALIMRFKNQVNPTSDIASVKAAWQDFIDHPLLQGTNQIPVQLAQELKQGTYRALGTKAYGELKGADIEAQKALARGLKEGVANAVPAVSALNAQESALLNALSMAERRALLDGNRNIGGLAPLGHGPLSIAALLADKSTLAKSLAARGLYSASNGPQQNQLQQLLTGILSENQ